jgi:CRISPR-associated protein (TIGR02584 family)
MKKQMPEKYPQRILLAVTGLSPQIVTETLYALCVAQQPHFIPTEIHILTTAEGAERARLNLLSEDGWFYRLCADYKLPKIHFNPRCIHVLEDVIGNRLDDIRSVEDNKQAANALTNAVREFTQNDNAALHVSIAGGRKTMGFYVGYALSLYGREQDRLSHVLVSSPYEAHPDFYYPTPYSRIIHTRFGNPRPMDTQEAQVTLAEIPFVRLRHGLPDKLLQGEASFSDAVHAVQQKIAPASIAISLINKRLYCGKTSIKIAAADLAFYAWFALRKRNGEAAIRYTSADKDEFLAIYAQVAGKHSCNLERVSKALRDGFTKEYFEQRKAKTHTALKKALGHQAGEYLLQSVGKRPNTCYEIGLDAGQIRVA